MGLHNKAEKFEMLVTKSAADKLINLADRLDGKYAQQMQMPSAGPADPTGEHATSAPSVADKFKSPPKAPSYAMSVMIPIKNILVPGTQITQAHIDQVQKAIDNWMKQHQFPAKPVAKL